MGFFCRGRLCSNIKIACKYNYCILAYLVIVCAPFWVDFGWELEGCSLEYIGHLNLFQDGANTIRFWIGFELPKWHLIDQKVSGWLVGHPLRICLESLFDANLPLLSVFCHFLAMDSAGCFKGSRKENGGPTSYSSWAGMLSSQPQVSDLMLFFFYALFILLPSQRSKHGNLFLWHISSFRVKVKWMTRTVVLPLIQTTN